MDGAKVDAKQKAEDVVSAGGAGDLQKNFLSDDAVLNKSENCVLDSGRKKRGRPRKQKPPKMTLQKKKTSTFYVPPDMSAIKILLEMEGCVEHLPIEEVAKRREELLKEIQELLQAEKGENE